MLSPALTLRRESRRHQGAILLDRSRRLRAGRTVLRITFARECGAEMFSGAMFGGPIRPDARGLAIGGSPGACRGADGYPNRRSESRVCSRLRSRKTETCPEIVGSLDRSPPCPDFGP